MANFQGDLSSDLMGLSLFATSTGITTDAQAAGGFVDTIDGVANIFTAIQVVGGLAGTGTPTLTTKLQESTDGVNNITDVTGGGFSAVTTTGNVAMLAFKPTKRYVRSTSTVSGTNPVAEVTTLIYAPRRHVPTAHGGFSTAAAAG